MPAEAQFTPTMPPAPSPGPQTTWRVGETVRHEHMHLFRKGFLFASPGTPMQACRATVTMVLAASELDFTLAVEDEPPQRAAIAIVRPGVLRRMLSPEAPYVCLDIYPIHPAYRTFSQRNTPACKTLPRGSIEGLDELVRNFYYAPPEDRAPHRLFRYAVEKIVATQPEPVPMDPRIIRALNLLIEQPTMSVELLAETLCLSTDRLSHVFSDEIGISLRKYLQALKIVAAAQYLNTRCSLREIALAAGFSDASHFSKVWSQNFGAPPAHFFQEALPISPPLPPPPQI